MKVTVEIDLEPKMWWKLSSDAERRGVRIGEIIREQLQHSVSSKRLQPTAEQIEDWKTAYEMGVSAVTIASRHEVTASTVIHHLRNAGVPIRSRAEGSRLALQQLRAVPNV